MKKLENVLSKPRRCHVVVRRVLGAPLLIALPCSDGEPACGPHVALAIAQDISGDRVDVCAEGTRGINSVKHRDDPDECLLHEIVGFIGIEPPRVPEAAHRRGEVPINGLQRGQCVGG